MDLHPFSLLEQSQQNQMTSATHRTAIEPAADAAAHIVIVVYEPTVTHRTDLIRHQQLVAGMATVVTAVVQLDHWPVLSACGSGFP
ncbi:hypothetical protein [Kribbella sp. NBC_00359]|uniref:hypothetical protein n=1 Tax=Kribbella sp. NBC_00359 TaxID=2975966 RepID=UPI002E1FDD76